MSNQGKRTGDEVIAAARNIKKVKKAFQNNQATVQDLQDADDRMRVARDNRLNYHDEKIQRGK